MAIEDYILIRKIMNGDKQAFDALVRKHYSNIYSYCYRRTGNSDDAADLTQEVFLKLVAAIYKYTFSGKFANFLFTIAVNTCIDYLRKSPPIADVDIYELKGTGNNPLDLVIDAEITNKLKSDIDQLPDIQREAIILHYYHGLKAKDIAEITSVPLATAKSRIKQGMDKLKKVYGKDNDNEQ